MARRADLSTCLRGDDPRRSAATPAPERAWRARQRPPQRAAASRPGARRRPARLHACNGTWTTLRALAHCATENTLGRFQSRTAATWHARWHAVHSRRASSPGRTEGPICSLEGRSRHRPPPAHTHTHPLSLALTSPAPAARRHACLGCHTAQNCMCLRICMCLGIVAFRALRPTVDLPLSPLAYRPSPTIHRTTHRARDLASNRTGAKATPPNAPPDTQVLVDRKLVPPLCFSEAALWPSNSIGGNRPVLTRVGVLPCPLCPPMQSSHGRVCLPVITHLAGRSDLPPRVNLKG
jgi:hypothetical protein